MHNNQDDIAIGTLLKIIATQLKTVGIEDPARESEMIIAEELGIPGAALAVEQDRIVPGEKVELIERIVERRLKHEPLQYIFGRAYFMNMWFHVGPGILIPRPETELLVEKVCREAPQGGEICDLGTGCGTIALAIAFERPDLKVTGVDISLRAMKTAQENRQEWKLDRVELLRSDLFSALADRRFDYITANLPYVSPAEYQLLPPEVRDYEPVLALKAEDEGLAIIHRAITTAPDFMKPEGRIIFEIGAAQGNAVMEMMSATGRYADINIIKDYNQHDRFVAGKAKSAPIHQ